MLGGLLCVALFALPVALLIGAVILRTAVSLTNRVVGAQASSEFDFDDDDEDDFIPRPRMQSAAPVPKPSLLRGMGILLAAAIVNSLVNFVFGMVLGGGADLLAQLIQIAVSFFIMVMMLAALLPTTLARASLVALFQFLIVLAIGLVIAAPMLFLGLTG